ncbi:MAG: hypoxanthine phosphoribosyltransferase [Bacteroidota bacterium]
MQNTMSDIVQAHDLSFQLYISEEDIQRRVREIGQALAAKFREDYPVFIGVLNGAFMFTADLVRATNIQCEVAFTRLSSYQGTSSTGHVNTLIGLDADLKGRHVIVVEDIVDTGGTLHQFKQTLSEKEPASITLVGFLMKPEVFKNRFKVDHVGYEIPNKFVIGYGLDYNGAGRQLSNIYQLKED